ncbi:hypothetical protein TNCV_2161331 [Trichonephila clavipes]|nr:hypothetical protein TNCV_2161331 [Trichonephila clavipes]
MDELIEMHEQSKALKKSESFDPIHLEDRLTVWNLTEDLSLFEKKATPDHLLFCAGLEREDIYSSPLLVYDFLRTLGLIDLV